MYSNFGVGKSDFFSSSFLPFSFSSLVNHVHIYERPDTNRQQQHETKPNSKAFPFLVKTQQTNEESNETGRLISNKTIGVLN